MNYKTYVKSLLEEDAPGAVAGDWEEGYSYLGSYSSTVIESNWEYIDEFLIKDKKCQLYQLKNNLEFILGYMGLDEDYYKNQLPQFEKKDRLITLFKLSASRKKTSERFFGVKKLIEVNAVVVSSDYQGTGIAKSIYQYFVNNLNYSLMSDSKQYKGARQLWSHLSRLNDVIVDVVDLSNNTIIDKDVTDLFQGKDDHDFNKKYWSYGSDKDDIRFILKYIK